MADPTKLQEQKLFDLFNYLIDKRVIISMQLMGTDFERLTCVTKVRRESDGPWLQIDMPEGFQAAATRFGVGALNLRFNFNGPDQLEYIFTTRGGFVKGRDLHLPFPEYVERIQRRKNFRMPTPIGTKMMFRTERGPAVLGVINISLGGIFGALVKPAAKDLQGSLLTMGQDIQHAGIVVPADSETEELIIIIHKMEVRRIEHDPERNIYRYAFEFKDILANETKKLTQAIYYFQRVFLQRR
ncbi:MAG: PilZ domain-containing protein [Desulfobacterales bacterium]|nr:PilZ domain-containing protein [Desulfobacterales bacterium]